MGGFAGLDVCGACVSFRAITSRVEQNRCSVQTKTKDNVFVTVKVAVQQSVVPERVEDAIYKLTNVHAQVDSYVSDVVRSHVPKMTLDEDFEKKDEISDAVQEQLAKNMAAYGFQIHKDLVTELQPDEVVKAAEAAADAAHLQGQGIARQRSAIIDGLKESITSGTGTQLTSDKVSELLLITQYFETLRDIGATSKAQTIFIPHSAGAIADVSSQIRNGVLQASAPSQGRM